MSKFTLTFDLPADPFDKTPEIVRVLRKMADEFDEFGTAGPVRDINGNTTGKWSFVTEVES
jgi:hypothetical protein